MNIVSPYLLTYIIMMVIYRLLEITVMRAYKSRKADGAGLRDKTHFKLVIPFMLAIIEPPVEHVLTGYQPSGLLFYGGICLFTIATLFRIKGLRDIKGGFSPYIEKQANHKLVTGGLYSVVRHPLYLSMLLLIIAAAFMQAAVGALIFILLTLAGVLARIKAEEKFMLEQFPEYRAYCRKTWRLVPGIY